jgi:hypothetical protein
MLTGMLEAALPGRWTVIKRRVRTNVYPSPKAGYEVQCPEGFIFRKEYSEGFEHRHGAHSRNFDDAETVKLLAGHINLAVEPCPPDCECRIWKYRIDKPLQSQISAKWKFFQRGLTPPQFLNYAKVAGRYRINLSHESIQMISRLVLSLGPVVCGYRFPSCRFPNPRRSFR